MMNAASLAGQELPLATACAALGLSRATIYRDQKPPRARANTTARPVSRKLSDAERAAIVDALHSEEFVDQPPGEIVATLLSRNQYLGSVRTFYRILAAMDEVRERRALRRHPTPSKPSVTATAPNQVWTWDITKIASSGGGWLYVYVLIDLFSRYVVGWLVSERENGKTAAQWLAETVRQHGVDATKLVVHNDRGAPMTSTTFTQLCTQLGVTQSFSRPRVSDDNPFIESHFKTMKYQPTYPGQFGSVLHARGWLETFFAWHNEGHHHAGLAMFTPSEVFRGKVEEVAERRQQALDAAYAAHPERFVKGPPRVRRPANAVSINPVTPAAAAPREHPELAETLPKASLRPVDRRSSTPARTAERKESGGSTRAAAASAESEASTGCRDLARSEHDGSLASSTGSRSSLPPHRPSITH
jgi:putative transposase